jgi:predicted transcriptional regulator YdeE
MDKPRIVTLGERRFAGISVVTDNEHELSGRGKIAALWERYRQGRVQQQICNRTEENLTIALYSQYESDETGLYICGLVGRPRGPIGGDRHSARDICGVYVQKGAAG